MEDPLSFRWITQIDCRAKPCDFIVPRQRVRAIKREFAKSKLAWLIFFRQSGGACRSSGVFSYVIMQTVLP